MLNLFSELLVLHRSRFMFPLCLSKTYSSTQKFSVSFIFRFFIRAEHSIYGLQIKSKSFISVTAACANGRLALKLYFEKICYLRRFPNWTPLQSAWNFSVDRTRFQSFDQSLIYIFLSNSSILPDFTNWAPILSLSFTHTSAHTIFSSLLSIYKFFNLILAIRFHTVYSKISIYQFFFVFSYIFLLWRCLRFYFEIIFYSSFLASHFSYFFFLSHSVAQVLFKYVECWYYVLWFYIFICARAF